MSILQITRCRECIYWDHRAGGLRSNQEPGICRLRPPVPVVDESKHCSTRTIWPQTRWWEGCADGQTTTSAAVEIDRRADTFNESTSADHNRANGAVGYADAASFLGVGQTTVRRLVEHGRLKTVRIGRRVMFRTSDLDAFVNGDGVDVIAQMDFP